MDHLNKILNQNKLSVALGLIGGTLLLGGLFVPNIVSKFKTAPSQTPPQNYSDSEIKKEIKVDISGAINSPGVISLSANSRVDDAIKAAGGISSEANFDYISKNINLSQRVIDGQKIYIPFKGEEFASQVSGVSTSSKIGLNSASETELESLPGVGAVTVAKIISGRPYSDVNDLLSKKIVSKVVFSKIKDLVEVR